MRTGTEVLGKQIVTFLDGKHIGKIHDLIFDHKNNMVLGFLTDEAGWFSSAEVLPLARVKSIGEDAVVVETADAISSAKDVPSMNETLQGGMVVRGTKLMTDSGKLIGTLSDMQFDEVSGRVEAYEVSGGLFADMYNGRSMVPAGTGLRLGDDVAFVPEETVALIESQVGGLKAAAQSASESVKGAAGNVADAAKQAGGNVKESASHVDTDNLKAQAQEKGGQLKEGAANLWETVKTKAGEYRDQAADKTEEYRINKALGHPASRVVLAKDDSVILNVGDIITHEAVEKARQAGELEILLGSVYDKEPVLTTEDMKAKSAQ